MKKIIKLVGVVVVFVMIMLPCKAIKATDGWGTYGDNINWHFYADTGVLQFEGTGEMPDANSFMSVPWYGYSENIKMVKIGKGITRIGDRAFYYLKNLTSVNISNTVKSIGYCSFYDTGIKKIVFPESIEEIGAGCFESCDNLKGVVIPGTVKTIPGSAFSHCKKLTSVTIKDGVEILGEECFRETAVVSIDIPSSVTSIYNGAFSYCGQLEHITIPSTITYVGARAYSCCSSLQYVEFEAKCAVPEHAFSCCNNLVAVKLGENVTSINYYAFNGCNKLEIIYIPSSVTEFEEGTFTSNGNIITFYGYTDTTAYSLAGKTKFINFVDVSAQGMQAWEKVWNAAIKKSDIKSKKTKKISFKSLKVVRNSKKITGKISVSNATVKIKVGNSKYKKATVNKNSFVLKTKKLKKNTVIRIRVTKNGYKTLNKLVKVK